MIALREMQSTVENPNRPLTAQVRQAMIAVWDGFQPADGLLHLLHYLDLHFPRSALLPALYYLTRNGLTGAKFMEWYRDKCGGTRPGLHSELLVAIKFDADSVDARRLKLIAGKNFQV